MKTLRGGTFDIFGYSPERKMERQLIKDYEATLETLLGSLDKNRLNLAVEIASVPDMIRGFGPVKEDNAKSAKIVLADLMAKWNGKPSEHSNQTAKAAE